MRFKNLVEQKEIRRKLRKTMTPAEMKIWYRLNRNQLGVRFFRQYGLDKYVVDFCCPKKKLIMEIDGDVHGFSNRQTKDMDRTFFLESLGYKVVRFANNDVLKNTDDVMEEIYRIVQPPISPFIKGGTKEGF